MAGIEIKKNFNIRPKLDPKAQEAKLRDASKMYEKQFLREIMKAMKKTVSHSTLSKPGYAENIYQNQLDNQYVEKWGDKGGIGLADLIFEQIKERHFKNKNIQKTNGPIPLNPKSKFIKSTETPSIHALPIEVKATDKDLSYIFKPSLFETNDLSVSAPWDGKVKSVYAHQDHQFVEIDHSQGMKSLLGFSGDMKAGVKAGQSVGQGQTLGMINNPDRPLYWKLLPGPKTSQS